jgi:hypothetical protein
MEKQEAINLLGGTITLAAKALGTTYQAVYKWPENLSPRLSDRVVGAAFRLNSKPWLRNLVINQQKTS